MFKKVILASLIAASFAAVPLAAVARPVFVTVAPPPPRQEAIPAPRRGFEWAPGHWEWRQRRHVWVGGHWVQARRGYAYQGATWVERNGRWEMQQGAWVRARGDRDGDGISNRRDRDRDGDGVPNRRDNAPNNPNYR